MLTTYGQSVLGENNQHLLFPALAHRVSLTEEVLPRAWALRILPSSTPGPVALISVFLSFLKHTKHESTSGPSPSLFRWSEAWSPIQLSNSHIHTIFLVSPPLAIRLPVLTLWYFSLCHVLRSDMLPIYSVGCCHLSSSILSPSRHTLEYIPMRSGDFVYHQHLE